MTVEALMNDEECYSNGVQQLSCVKRGIRIYEWLEAWMVGMHVLVNCLSKCELIYTTW